MSLSMDKKIFIILGINIRSSSVPTIIDELIDSIQEKQIKLLAFANAHTLNISYENKEYQKTLQKFLVLNDGIGVDLASKLLYNKNFEENLNGTDFMPAFFNALPPGTKLFFLGSVEKNIQLAAENFIKTYPNLNLVGIHNGYFTDDSIIINIINEKNPDILVVGFGNPLQEFWIEKNSTEINSSLIIGVGAFFDFYSGEINRAPKIVRKIHLEWLFRLLLEPKRLWKRYVLGNFLFIFRVFKQKFK